MKRIRKIALALAVAVIAVTSLSAATWVWSTPYDNVTGYRYQIGSESEEGWIYVDKDVTSLTLDSKEETTIYVQLTVDNGRFWSPSGVATYVPQAVVTPENLTSEEQTIVEPEAEIVEPAVVETPVEEVPVVEEVVEEPVVEEVVPVEEAPVEEVVVEEVPVEEVPAEVVEEVAVEEPVVEEVLPAEEVVEEAVPAEEPVVEEVAVEEAPVDETVFVEAVKVKKGKDFSFGMGLSVASEFMDHTYSIQPMLNFNFQNVASPADWFGLDIDMNFIGLFTPNANLNGGFMKFFENMLSSKLAMGGAAELVIRPTFMMGSFELGIGLGGGVNIYAASTLAGKEFLNKIPELMKNDAIKLNAYALAGADATFNFNDTFAMGVGYRFKYIFDKDLNDSKMSHSAVVSMGLSF